MNERARLAQRLCKVHDRLIDIGLGEVDASAPAVTALKAIQAKLMSDVSPEDFEKTTAETTTIEQDMTKLVQVLDTNAIVHLVRHQRAEAARIHEELGKQLENKVIALKCGTI